MSNEEVIPVGKITGAHGIRGEAKVHMFGGVDEFPFKTLMTAPPGKAPADKPEHLNVRAVRRHKGVFLVLFEGYSTRSEAETLTGTGLYVFRSDLPELSPGEFYVEDLVGIGVFTEDDRDLGVVTGIIPTGASDVLEIKGPEGEFLLPMAGDFIQSVDIDGRRLVVRLIEGLLPGEK